MKIIDKVELFVNICNEINQFDKKEIKNLLDLKRYKQSESKLSIEEYLTLVLLHKFSYCSNLKKFWYQEKFFSSNAWPEMPSYPRFIIWINRLSILMKNILDKYLVKLNSLGFLDSTKIETTNSFYKGKIYKEANKGHSSTGEFRGFKLHILLQENNTVCSYEITPASTHDLTPVKGELLLNQQGRILADSGYVSKEIYYKLMEQNIWLIAKPRASMMENNFFGFSYLPNWDNFKKIYKKRISIERFFNELKNNLNLKINQLHSKKSLFLHIYSSLLASQMDALGKISYKTI